VEPGGRITAIVGVTGVVDDVDDIVVPGAFVKTLQRRRPKGVKAHDWKVDVARCPYNEEWFPGDPRLPKLGPDGKPWPAEAGALVMTFEYNLKVARSRDEYEMVKFYAETGEACFSIGYKVVPGKASKRSDGVRMIYELELFEGSSVLHGAHPLTMALDVKGSDADGLERKYTTGWWGEKAAEQMAGKGSMIALYPGPDVAGQLAHPDGSPAGELHITLAYLPENRHTPDELAALVAPAAEACGPLEGQVGGLGQFPPGDTGTPTFVPVDVPNVHLLHEAVKSLLKEGGVKVADQHGYTPHMTLGYDLDGATPAPATQVKFDRMYAVVGGQKTEIPLGGQAPAPVESKAARMVVAAALALEAKGLPKTQKCAHCDAQATKRVLHAEGMAYVPTCDEHLGKTKDEIGASDVSGVRDIPPVEGKSGNADGLKDWYTHGGGAAEIAWGTPGDFDRCVAVAGKHMTEEQAAGWCNLRHHDATGMYPATHAKLDGKTLIRLVPAAFSSARSAVAAAGGGHDSDLGLVVSVAQDVAQKGSPDVLRVGDRFQVLGADATPYTAEVVRLSSFGQGAVGQLEGKLVGGHELAVDPDASVVLPALRAREQKARAEVLTPGWERSLDGLGSEPLGRRSVPAAQRDVKSRVAVSVDPEVVPGAPPALLVRLGAPGSVASSAHAPHHTATWLLYDAKLDRGKSASGTSAKAVVAAALSMKTTETKTMPYMPGSFEYLQDQLRDAARDLLFPPAERGSDAPSPWVCLTATYPDHIVVDASGLDSDGESYSIPYTVEPSGQVSLGTPQAVDVIAVVIPERDAAEDAAEASGDAAEKARYVDPTVAALKEATARVALAPLGGKQLEAGVRDALLGLLDELAVKGADVSGMVMGDDSDDEDLDRMRRRDDVDPLADDTDDDTDDGTPGKGLPPRAPAGSVEDDETDTDPDEDADSDYIPEGVDAEASDPEDIADGGSDEDTEDESDDGTVKLDPDELRKQLASLH
jgi:2'-5' RNA ligase